MALTAWALGRLRSLPLRVRLMGFAMLCALPLAVLSILEVRKDVARVGDEATSSAERAAVRLQARLTQTLAAAEDTARLLAALDLDSESGRSRCSSILARSPRSAPTGLLNYLAVNTKGDVVCSARPLATPINSADRPHFQQALRTGQPALSGYVVGRVTGRGALQLVVPFPESSTGMGHMGVAVMSAKELTFSESESGATPLTVSVFDRSGVLVSRYPESPDIRPGADFSGSELFGRTTGAAAAADSAGLDGRARHYAFRRVDFHGEPALWISSGVDVAALESAALSEGMRELAVVLLVLVCVVALAGIASGPFILARYRGMQELARAISTGNRASRIELKWRDELTPVEGALNQMLDAVDRQTAQARDLNEQAELDTLQYKQLSRRLMEVEEHERKRLGMELHDQVGANLSALILCLELIRSELQSPTSPALLKRMADFEAVLHDTVGHVRSVLEDLRPAGLDELGLVAALRHQAGVLTARTNVGFVIRVLAPFPRLRAKCEIGFYRIAQEAWTNVLKHAQARRVTLTLGQDGPKVFMEIQDDGQGFAMPTVPAAAGSLGLATMRDRAGGMGATLQFDSAQGEGARLRLSMDRGDCVVPG